MVGVFYLCFTSTAQILTKSTCTCKVTQRWVEISPHWCNHQFIPQYIRWKPTLQSQESFHKIGDYTNRSNPIKIYLMTDFVWILSEMSHHVNEYRTAKGELILNLLGFVSALENRQRWDMKWNMLIEYTASWSLHPKRNKHPKETQSKKYKI